MTDSHKGKTIFIPTLPGGRHNFDKILFLFKMSKYFKNVSLEINVTCYQHGNILRRVLLSFLVTVKAAPHECENKTVPLVYFRHG